MSKAAVTIGLVGSLLLGSGLAQATPDDSMFSLGGSLYWIDMEATDVITMEFKGGAIVGSAAFNEHVAVRGSLYKTTWDTNDDVEMVGFDAQLLLGGNLNRKGFKYYLALGLFDERMRMKGSDDGVDFSGTQIGFGLGYNWSRVALDYTFYGRAADDYAKFIEDSGLMRIAGVSRSEVSATSSTLSLSLRF